MFRLEYAFIAKFFFCSGQSRVKLNTEINKFGRNIKVLTILEMSFLKLPKVLKHPRDIKNFLEDFYKKRGELDETVNNTNENVKIANRNFQNR